MLRGRRPTVSRSAATGCESEPSKTPIVGVRIGWLVAGSRPDALRVDFPGNPSSTAQDALSAAATTMDGATLDRAVLSRQPAVLTFIDGDPARPVVLGLVPTPTSPFVELVGASAAPTGAAQETSPPAKLEAVVDGRRVVLEGKDEVVLKCGDASITLRHDGRIVVQGRYVETAATGTNRIKGGVVKIN